ncbi:MAG: peroxide stress protein YaaA [Betaproteobacteria bacterium]|nr:peroxide stress protein YaaA [Betaproteobacteria bacterium]
MFTLLSPAKTLDFDTPPHVEAYSQCAWLDESAGLVERLCRFDPVGLADLMQLSDKLSVLNVARYHTWALPFTPENAKQAVLTFAGDVYEGLNATSLTADDLAFTQSRLGILSGLYGLLRPLDLIQPYRLEMGTRLPTERGDDLYAWWGNSLCLAVQEATQNSGGEAILVNLASEEYFKAVRAARLDVPVLQPVFMDRKGDRYRVVSFHAKRARGLMTRFIIENRLEKVEGLKDFAAEGYAFNPAGSEGNRLLFIRG